jgi:hypothetical protein
VLAFDFVFKGFLAPEYEEWFIVAAGRLLAGGTSGLAGLDAVVDGGETVGWAFLLYKSVALVISRANCDCLKK